MEKILVQDTDTFPSRLNVEKMMNPATFSFSNLGEEEKGEVEERLNILILLLFWSY